MVVDNGMVSSSAAGLLCTPISVGEDRTMTVGTLSVRDFWYLPSITKPFSVVRNNKSANLRVRILLVLDHAYIVAVGLGCSVTHTLCKQDGKHLGTLCKRHYERLQW
jgi:hypothetical protein